MYNLLVSGNESAWEGKTYEYDLERFCEHTARELREKYLPFEEDVVRKLVTFPALFAYEYQRKKPARVGKIIKVLSRSRKLRVEYALDPNVNPIPIEKIAALEWDLGIGEWEMNRTHWAVKSSDLFSVLGIRAAGRKGRGAARSKTAKGEMPLAIESLESVVSSEVVKRALGDARVLLETRGATSALDRVHTALHGYLKSVCKELEVEIQDNLTANQLLKTIRKSHPAFKNLDVRGSDIEKILNSISAIVDATGPLRNHGSIAHPNEKLVGDSESLLVINAILTIIGYLDQKLSSRK